MSDVEEQEDEIQSNEEEVSDVLFEQDALIIQDDIDIISGGDDDANDNLVLAEADFDGKSALRGFGYNLLANEDGSLKYPEVHLDKEMIRTGLSHIARTLDTFEFAYSRYDGRNRALTEIDILGQYVHLRAVDLSGNRIKSFKSLAPMKHLLVLLVNDNQMISLEEIPHLPFLQALSAKRNGLKSAQGLFSNSLTHLQLSFNKISNLIPFDDATFPNLTVLELRGNNLQSLNGLNVPTLIRLFVAQNKLKNLNGLKTCTNLTHLHARDNVISTLENFPRLEKLEYVNLRNNLLKRFSQTQFLGNSPNIRTLIAMGNPVAELDDYKMEMIAANPNLKRLDKQPITEIDLVQGRQIRSGREKGILPPVNDDSEVLTPPMPSMEDTMAEEDEEDEDDDDNDDGSPPPEDPEDQDKDQEPPPRSSGGPEMDVEIRKAST